MKRKRLWLSIGLAAACTAAVLLFLFFMYRSSYDSLEARYAQGNLSGTIVAVAAIDKKHIDAERRIIAHFLVANCYRQLGLNREFQAELERLQALPGADDRINLARAMFKIQHGELSDSPSALIETLQSAGALASDAHSVAIQGTLAAGRLDEAQQLLDQWRAQYSGNSAAPPQLEFLKAVLWNVSGLTDKAEAQLISTIEHYPEHELSWLALAELYSRPPNVRFAQSEYVLERLQARFPHNPDVHVRLARVRRRLAQGAQSLSELASTDSDAELFEKANLEFDAGNFQQATVALKASRLGTLEDLRRLTDAAFELSLRGQGDAGGQLTDRVSWAATTLALSGDQSTARAAFDDAADRTARLRRLQDLSNQQAVAPQSTTIAKEMNEVAALATPFIARPLERFAAADRRTPERSVATGSAEDPRGLELFQTHCANCHGASGRGDGRAACNLFPAPRNFRNEPIRLVSSENRVASDDDLVRTIRRGEPGTAMPAFERLSDAEVVSLVAVVRQFMDDGLREIYAREFPVQDSPPHDVESRARAEQEWVVARTQPGSPLALPDLTATSERVAHGGELFGEAGCANCHGTSHEPPLTTTRLFDSLGRPLRAPRLDVDAFHGGEDASELYKRIALGIPGTPHPALASPTAGDIASLVAYIQSMRAAIPIH